MSVACGVIVIVASWEKRACCPGGGRGAVGIKKKIISVSYVYAFVGFCPVTTYVAARASVVLLAVRGRGSGVLCVSFFGCVAKAFMLERSARTHTPYVAESRYFPP